MVTIHRVEILKLIAQNCSGRWEHKHLVVMVRRGYPRERIYRCGFLERLLMLLPLLSYRCIVVYVGISALLHAIEKGTESELLGIIRIVIEY